MLRFKVLLQYNYIYYLILTLAILLAIFRIYIIKMTSNYSIDDKIIIGTITNITFKNDKYNIEILGKERLHGYYKTEEELNLKIGMKIKVLGELYTPINNTIPNTFNYKKYLNNHNSYYLIKIDNIIILNKKLSLLYNIKNFINNRVDAFKYTNHYLKALLMGNTKELDEEIYKEYQINGVTHLFAISGMHINLLAALIYFFIKKINIKEIYKYIIQIILLIIFCLIINSTISVYRSLIFFILIIINKIFDFKISTKNILFITVSILLVYNPLVIFDLGFQYSILTTYGLIISTKKKQGNFIKKTLYTSMMAFLFSMPITLFNFYEISLLTPINNLIIAPLVTMIIYPLSLITVLFKFFEPLLYFILKFMELINSILSSFKIFIIMIPKVNILLYFIYYILLIIYVYSRNNKYLIISILLIFSFKLKFILDNNTYIYFLDVGQGDSILIYNKKESILIDTGGVYNYTVSDNTITFFKSIGLKKIDLLLITHGDYDHINDATNIINKFKVKNIMLNNNEYNELELSIVNNNKIIKNYKSSLDFKIFNNYIGRDENSSSIISLLKVNNINILFMGDASKKEELLFLNDNDIKVDIIKLGHHGSKTSSDYNFLKKLDIKEAIISSGRNNRFNHPSPETIETLEELNIKYYDTKENGTIRYKFGQNRYTKKLYLP